MGSAYTPASILVLAGSLARPPPHGAHDPHHIISTTNTNVRDTSTNSTNTTTNRNTHPTNTANTSNTTITSKSTSLLENLHVAEAGECTATSTSVAPPGYGSVIPDELRPSASGNTDAAVAASSAAATAAAATTPATTTKRTAFYKKVTNFIVRLPGECYGLAAPKMLCRFLT